MMSKGQRVMLNARQRAIRSNVRAFLMVADRREMMAELEISAEQGDTFRADCIREMIAEDAQGIQEATSGL